MTREIVRTVIGPGFGIFVGTAAYSYFTSTPHQVDWPRAVFVGAFSAVGVWLWTSFKARRAPKPLP